jgi:hypothetical protein
VVSKSAVQDEGVQDLIEAGAVAALLQGLVKRGRYNVWLAKTTSVWLDLDAVLDCGICNQAPPQMFCLQYCLSPTVQCRGMPKALLAHSNQILGMVALQHDHISPEDVTQVRLFSLFRRPYLYWRDGL